MKLLKVALAIVFFGIMAALSAAPLNLWVYGYLMLFPVFYLVESTHFNLKKTLLLGYMLTLSFNVFTGYWLIYTINVFGHMPLPLAAFVFVLYTLITAGRFTIFLLVVRLWKYLGGSGDVPFKNLIQNRYFAYTFAWGFSEYFGWQLFHALGGNFAAGDKYLLQTADLVGVYGVSLFWVLTNLVVYDLYHLLVKNRSQLKLKVFFSNRSLNFSLILILILHVYGYFSYGYWKSKSTDYPVKRIALVQGNAPLAFEANRSIFDQVKGTLDSIISQTTNLLEEDKKNGKQPDLVVWPESSVPFLTIQNPGIFLNALNDLHKTYKVPMIVNDIFTETIGNRNYYYNNLWLLNSEGYRAGFYHKIELLPFGEFIPLANFFPAVYKLVPEVGGFMPGHEKKILSLDSLKIIPSICYELLPPEFTLDYFNKSGSLGQIIINITNDTWFGDSTEPAEHIKASSIRAIEMRLPIIRATNSGISAYIDTTGEIIDPTEIFTRDTRIYEVPIPDRSHSVYAAIGIWPFRLFLFSGIILWAFVYYSIALRKEN